MVEKIEKHEYCPDWKRLLTWNAKFVPTKILKPYFSFSETIAEYGTFGNLQTILRNQLR